MTIKLDFDQDTKILKATVTGELLLPEITSAFDKITNSDDYPSNVDTLWDMRKANFDSTNAEFWQALIGIRRQDYPKRKNFRLALVASSDFSFGMLRMYEMLSEPHLHRKLMVFRDMATAEQWLIENSS